MAITATCAINDNTLKAEERGTIACTVSNSGGAAVLVTGIQPTCTINGETEQSVSVALGQPAFGGAFPQSVAASGSTIFYWDVLAHAPTTSWGLATPASLVYSFGATILTNDGSTTVATPVTATITNPAGL
jgi:hypothetical protein